MSARDLGLLALRVGVGGTLVAHGAQKLFGWFGGHGLDATAQGFESIGHRARRRHAGVGGGAESGGGGRLATGAAAPPPAAARTGWLM